MDAEMSAELIVRDRRRAMRHPVHGGGIYPSIIFHQNWTSLPGPATINGFKDRCVTFRQRFSIQVVGTRPALAFKRLSRLAILYSKGCTLGNSVYSVLEPVETLC